jgi:SAM-dependent methyltransferase
LIVDGSYFKPHIVLAATHDGELVALLRDSRGIRHSYCLTAWRIGVDQAGLSFYRANLAHVHHFGFGFHADACAPGILALLDRVREQDGLVVELGCGSGLLTRHLVEGGHRVIATDASPAMLDLARGYAPNVEDFRLLVLPDDPIPPADAIVSVGHVLSYLPDEEAIWRALAAACGALRPGGVLAIDVCDLKWGELRRDTPLSAWVNDEWVLVTRFSVPAPSRFVRELTTFLRGDDGSWRRDDERHENVLIDTSRLPALLQQYGVDAAVGSSFGVHDLPAGLATVIGHRSTDDAAETGSRG